MVSVNGALPDGGDVGDRRDIARTPSARPVIAVPTVLLWTGALAVWSLATSVVFSDASRWWLAATIPAQALVSFSMFTVLHESIHHTVSRLSWVNHLFGRMSLPFVSVFGTLAVLRFIHHEHHRHTNEDVRVDPDAWSLAGPSWLLPVRWMSIDAGYCRFYLARCRHRRHTESIGYFANLLVVTVLLGVAVAAGYGWELLTVCIIPQRIGLGLLALLFDWLPHHGLVPAKTDRFRATRVRVGCEPIMNRLLFYQNYHAVHHIHPSIPFDAYVAEWKRSSGHYLDRNVPMSSTWGRELTVIEYRARRTTVANGSPLKVASAAHRAFNQSLAALLSTGIIEVHLRDSRRGEDHV